MVHDIPERWIFTPAHSQTLPPDDEWWHGFNDPMLDSLISEAVDRNYNVAIAARRIDAANAAIMSARSSYFPMVGNRPLWPRGLFGKRKESPERSGPRRL